MKAMYRHEIADRIRATLREVQFWSETGVLGPKLRCDHNRTHPRFTETDLYRAAMVKELRKRRVTLVEIRKHHELFEYPPPGEFLVIADRAPLNFQWFEKEAQMLRFLAGLDGPGLIISRRDVERRFHGFAS